MKAARARCRCRRPWSPGGPPHHLLAALVLLCAAAGVCGQQRQLSPTVMVNGFGDLEGAVKGSGLPVCQYTVQRAKGLTTSLSFALAVFPMMPDKETLESWTYKDPSGTNIPATPAAIQRWRDGLQRCLQYAIDQGFTTLHLLPHFDPLHPVLLRPTSWRNLINLAPKQKASGDGLTYDDVMLAPLTAALEGVASPRVALWFSVAGEMGLSNFLNPEAWRAALTDARSRLQKKPYSSVRVATALNWQMVCGCIGATSDPVAGMFDPVKYNASYSQEFERVRQDALKLAPGFKALLAANDFIALSGYGSGYPTDASQLSYSTMELPLHTLAYELSFFGISLAAYMDRPVVYVEQGLGGALHYGLLPAPDLSTLTRYPMTGAWPHNGYNKEVDPWLKPDFAAWRRKFYQATVDLLQRGRGDRYRLDGVYVWSVGSFDVFGVHPVSSSSEGTFADTSIIAMAKKQNGMAA